MAANKTIRIGPVAIANAVGNLINPPTLIGGVNPPAVSTNAYLILRKIRVTNKTGAAATFTLYIGLTGGSAAGTEIVVAKSVPANDAVEIFSLMRLDVADFLTGLASAATTLVLEAEGEIGVA